MADARGIVKSVSWLDIFPGLILIRTVRLATRMGLVLVAAAGFLVMTAGWRVLDGVLLSDEDVANAARLEFDREYFGRWPGARGPQVLPANWPPLSQVQHTAPEIPVSGFFYRATRPFFSQFEGLTATASAYYLIGGLVNVLVWSLFGGIIARTAALNLGRDERVTALAAIAHGRQKWAAHVGAVGLPACGAIVTCLPILALGALMRWEFGILLGGIVWLLVIAAAAVACVFLAGLLFGWPLMWGTIGSEASDSFDAISRAYAYTFQRPFQYAWYVLLAIVIGLVGWLFVWVTTELFLFLSTWSVSLTAGDAHGSLIRQAVSIPDASTPADIDAGTGQIGTGARLGLSLIGLSAGFVRMLASSFAFSYFWCAATAIYLLLRLDVDNADLDDIHVAEESAQRFGLPHLATDEAKNSNADLADQDARTDSTGEA